VLAIMRVLPGFAPALMRITVDDDEHVVRAMMVAVANGTSYGGGMRVAPDAKLDSGELEVCIVGDVGRLEFVRAFPRVFRGTHTDHPKVTMLRGRRIGIESDRPLSMIGDGDLCGTLPGVISVEPHSLLVVVGGRDHRTSAA
jgi:diacylglycerol kinase (ATP)